MLMYLNGSYKSLYCLPHDLLTAKIETYCLDKILTIIFDYLNRVGSFYSSSYDIIEGIPQESILEPSHFNIF